MKKIMYLVAIIFLMGCSKEDLCSDNTCLNSGICNDGKCACPPGYIGDDCSLQDIPRVVAISAIKILKFPKKNPDGGDWDAGGFPDLFLVIINEQSLVWQSDDLRADASSFLQYTFSPYPNVRLTATTSPHEIGLFDYDGDKSEYMGSALFVPYVYGFPYTLNVENGGTAFEMTISYLFY